MTCPTGLGRISPDMAPCKLIYKPVLLLFLALGIRGIANAQLAITSVTPTPICAGASLTVNFSSAGATNYGLTSAYLVAPGGALTLLGTQVVTMDGNYNISGPVPGGFMGKYAVRVTSVASSAEAPDSLTVNPLPAVQVSSMVVCSGLPVNLGLASSTGAGSTFIWLPLAQTGAGGASTQAVFTTGPITDILTTSDHVSAGSVTYSITAKSAEGCTGSPESVVVTVNPDPVLTGTGPTPTICSGAPINFQPTASTPGMSTFSWGASPIDVTGATQSAPFVSGPINDILSTTTHTTPGSVSYTITPKSNQGCTGSSAIYSITVNPDPVVTSAAPATPICSGGAINIPLSASTPGVTTFTWSPTQTGVAGASTQFPTFASGPIGDVVTTTTHTTAGTVSYLVTPKSSLGCVGASTTFTVGVNPDPVVTNAPPAPICSGGLLSIPLTASTPGASTFTWVATPTLVTGATSQSPAFTSGPIAGVLTGNSNTTAGTVSYVVTPKSNLGCLGAAATLTVTVNPAPVITSAAPATPMCAGTALNIPLSASTPGLSTFTWTPTQTGGVTGASNQFPTFAAGPISSIINTPDHATGGSVSYLITPKSSVGCVGASTSITVAVNPDPALASPAPPTIICSGSPINIPLIASTAGPSTYTWSATQTGVSGATQSATFVAGPISNTLNTTTHTTAGTVSYVITPKSGLGCVGAPTTFNIAVNPDPVVTSTAPPSALCSGSALSLPLTASTAGASTFTWVPTPTGVNGATAQAPVFASGPINATLTATSNATAGSVSYFVTPKSAAGCIGASTTLVVNVNPAPVISSPAPPTVTCSGSPFNIPVAASTGAGSTFMWSVTSSPTVTGATGSSTFVSGPINNVLTTGTNQTGTVTYTITPRSAAQCVSLNPTTYTVVVNPVPRLTKTLDSVCSGSPYNQPFVSTASGGTYSWTAFGTNPNLTITGSSTGAGAIPNTFSYTNPSYGLSDTVKYSVTTNAGGAGGCFSTDTFRLKVHPRPVITNINPSPICSGLPVSVLLKSSVIDSNNVSYTWSYSSATVSNNGGLTFCPGCSAISQTLSSTVPALDSARYQITGDYRGCVSMTAKSIYVRVNPRPKLTGLPFTSPVCSGTITNIPVSADVPSTYTWTRTNVSGIPSVTGPTSGSVIIDTLINLSNITQAQVGYTVRPTSVLGQCLGTDSAFLIAINPTPIVTPSNYTICSGDSIIINLAAATSTVGGNSWEYTYNQSPTASGGVSSGPSPLASIRRRLLNSSDAVRAFVVYGIRARSAACSSAVVNDTVFINPLPSFTSNRDTSICSDSVLVYNVKASTGASTRYAWLKVGAFGAPGNPSNFQFLNVPLVDSLNTGGVLGTRSITYNIVLRSSENCFSDSTILTRPQLNVTINPTPDTVGVSVRPAKICEGAEMLNFSSRRTPVSPERFSWGVSTGTAYDIGGENALISFPVPGTHSVFVTSNVPGFSCRSKPQPMTIAVDPGAVRKPNVVRFENSLVCLTGATGGTITGYQWGYDVRQNLDSVLLPGETFQSYVFTTLDTTNKAYWVMATYAEGGCAYKAYFNRPATLGLGDNVSATSPLYMTVYPNPASSQLNVELPRLSSPVELEIIDMTGRRAMQKLTAKGSMRLDIANLPSGCYFLNCHEDGKRVATARFIKN